ncbi:MAG: cytochrome c oxidase assembly protein [Pseudonocardiales bacterium]|nr:MAG: cytochrome c oxidase assembly protein [Pseudonocardiales bacterium]
MSLAHGTEPAFSPARLITASSPLQWSALFLVVAAVAYASGVLRLRRRGDRWPARRTLAFVVGGLGAVAIALLSGLAAYDDTLFSAHMVQHMILIMIAPIFLALGAPITLALRTLPGRPRRAVLAVLHSRVAAVATFPLVGFALFTLSSYALYFTGIYEATLRNSLLHEFVHVHFLVVGCLFFWPLLGLDPVPGRIAYPFRALLMFASMPFHAILGLTVMQSRHVLAGNYYAEAAPRLDHLADQGVGGGLLWASGDLVALLMLGVLLVQWMRASEREAQREDRRLDRLEALEAQEAASAES